MQAKRFQCKTQKGIDIKPITNEHKSNWTTTIILLFLWRGNRTKEILGQHTQTISKLSTGWSNLQFTAQHQPSRSTFEESPHEFNRVQVPLKVCLGLPPLFYTHILNCGREARDASHEARAWTKGARGERASAYAAPQRGCGEKEGERPRTIL